MIAFSLSYGVITHGQLLDGIDVAGQSFSWPVGYPTPEAQLARLYALTFTLDTKEGISAVSPSFEIAEGSSDNNVADGEEYDDDSPGSSEPKSRPATTSLAILSTAPSYTPSLKPILTDSQSSSSTMSTVASIPSQSGLSDLGERPGLSPTEIGGIAIGTVVAIFIGVIVLILYRRRRVLHLKRPSNSHSSIYGLFRKAELDAEGQEIKGTKLLCELDATREVQELDSRMKPAELDPTVVRYELPAADVERQHESTHTTL